MAADSSTPEDPNPAPPTQAGPDWFTRKAGEHTPGLSDLTADYLQGLPEHLRVQALLVLKELDALGIASISADTEMAMINNISDEYRSKKLYKVVCDLSTKMVQILREIDYYIKKVEVNTVYVAEPGSPGTPEAAAMEARLMAAIRTQGLKTNGITHLKKDQNGKHFIWAGRGDPDSGDGEWIPQVFKQCTHKTNS